ncbi:MAG: Mur ligase domain-containing protein, partial [Nocardioidaceae bacterium]
MSSPESSWSSVPSRPTRIDPVALSEIAAHLSVPMPSEESEPGSVTGVSQSSHAIRPGDLYAALPGARTHGACFAVAAADAGAVACLTDSEGASIARDS